MSFLCFRKSCSSSLNFGKVFNGREGIFGPLYETLLISAFKIDGVCVYTLAGNIEVKLPIYQIGAEKWNVGT
jgi:hypothetical protein